MHQPPMSPHSSAHHAFSELAAWGYRVAPSDHIIQGGHVVTAEFLF